MRRLGFDDAASALEAADALTPAPEPDQDEPVPDRPQHRADASQLAEEQRQREGEVLLAALKRDLGPSAFSDR